MHLKILLIMFYYFKVLNPDPEYGFLVKNCFAFDNRDSPAVQLVDDR